MRLRVFWFLALPALLNRLHRLITLPFAAYFLTASSALHPAYGLSRWDLMALVFRFFWNGRRVQSESSYRAHWVIALKLLEMAPEIPGYVVECGCFKGGMTVNLSIVCKIVGRKLVVYDSFEGLPPPTNRDTAWPEGVPYRTGAYGGTLEEVQENVRRYGEISVCEMRKGWFKDTLKHHTEPVALVVADVDFHSSLYDCVTQLWPHLIPGGFFFVDEYIFVDYCALFYSEKFWQTHFQCAPPGLIGAGAGVQLGEYFVGPWYQPNLAHNPASIAYTQKGWKALWDYYPSEHDWGLKWPAASGAEDEAKPRNDPA